MVNTVYLTLFEVFAYLVVNFAGGVQRRTQGFLHHNAGWFGVQLRFAQPFADCTKGAWRHGKVVDGNAVLLVQHLAQAGKGCRVIHVQVAEI